MTFNPFSVAGVVSLLRKYLQSSMQTTRCNYVQVAVARLFDQARVPLISDSVSTVLILS